MATWEDGPEYAPVDWPTGFIAPATSVLSAAPLTTGTSAGAPTTPPERFDPPREPVPSLVTLVPSTGPSRDPREPFQVAAAIITDGSAWGSAHSVQAIASPAAPTGWTPEQAVAPVYAPPPPVQGYPAPGTPQWFGPPATYESSQFQVPLTAASVAEGLGWGMIITLVLGGIVPLLSPVLLVIAFFLIGQTRFRTRVLKVGFIVAMAIVGLAGVGGFVGSEDAWGPMGTTSMIGCWVLLVYGIVIQVVAIQHGDRPER